MILALALWTETIVHPVKDVATHEMLRTISQEKDRVARGQALGALAVIHDPADAPWIRPRLDDPIAAVQLDARQAASALELPLPAGPAPTLFIDLDVTPAAPPAATTVATSLHNLPAATAPAAAATILDGIRSPDVVVQQEAVRAAQRCGIVAAVPGLLPLLADEDEGLRRAACEALQVLGPKSDSAEIVPALAACMNAEQSFLVLRAAANALLAMHNPAAQEALAQLLLHPRAWVRLASVRSLGDWGRPEVAPVLFPLLDDKDLLVEMSAVESVGKLRHPESPARLLARLTHGPDPVQERVAWWLGELRVSGALKPLLNLVQSGKAGTEVGPGTLGNAAEALGKLGDPQASPALRKLLATNALELADARLGALKGLTLLRDREAMPRVFELLTEPVIFPPPPSPAVPMFDGPEVRGVCLRYLGRFGDAAMGERIFRSIKDVLVPELRPLLAETLHTLTGKFYRPVPNEDYRRYFVESLEPPAFPSSPSRPGVVLVPDRE